MTTPMKVTVKYFASIREELGVTSESVTTTAPTLAHLRDELMGRNAAYGEALARGRAVRMALNQTLGDESELLTDGAEVAFFPPVTGG